MDQSLVTVTVAAASTLLASVDDLKAELGIATDDNSRLFRYVRTASQQVCQYLNRTLAQETVSEVFRLDRGRRCVESLNLDRYPVTTITSVTEDGTILTTADYECDQRSGQLFRLSNDRRCPWTAAKVTILYQGGYVLLPDRAANLPADIEAATIRLATQLYSDPEREPGLRSEIVPGVLERQYWDQTASGEQAGSLSPDLQALLDPYRRIALA